MQHEVGMRVNYADKDAITSLSRYINKFINDKTVIVCIGTDKCIGDCLGPLVGTLLAKSNYPLPLVGTLEYPAHAVNLDSTIKYVNEEYKDYFIIAIDACLGYSEYIGDIQVKLGPVHPGKGVGKSLPYIGDISIVGVVDSLDVSDIFSIRSIRLNLIMKMAEVISTAIINSAK